MFATFETQQVRSWFSRPKRIGVDRIRRGLVFLVATLLAFGGRGQVTRAADGDLDPSFGNGGTVVTDFNNSVDHLSRIALQPDGKVVTIGTTTISGSSTNKYALARYNSDGTLDATFGTGGKVVTVIANVLENANALLLLPDGKIMIGGSIAQPSVVDSSFALLRYNTDGSLDTTFGNGGIVRTNVGTYLDSIGALALQSDGKIVAAGNTAIPRPPGEQRNSDIAVARYNPDGSLDPAFGNNGIVISDFGPVPNYFADDATAVILQPDGKIIVAGDSDGGGYFDFLVARYNTNGTLDSTFGSGGFRKTDVGNGFEDGASDAALQADGKIILAGAANRSEAANLDFAMVRYNSNGTLDPTFGSGGRVVFVLNNLADEEITSVVLQGDGKIVALGDSNSSANSGLLLFRFQSNGSLDPSFGNGGIVRTPFGANAMQSEAFALQADGKLVAGGYTPLYNTSDFALARYLDSATPGPTPTPAPTATATPTASASPTPTPSPSCNVTISPPNHSFTADGGSKFINVEADNSCSWMATSNANWITITSGGSGSGWGTVYYSVASYTNTTLRSGTISVGSRTFTVYQGPEALQGAPDIVWMGLGHTTSANAVSFSPDGQFLASASSDRTVKIWRVSNGSLVRTLTGFFDRVTSVAFSHNGQTLAAGSVDRNLKAWNVSDWSLIATVANTDFIFGVAFSPNDSRLAEAGGYSGDWIHILRTFDWQEIELHGYGQSQNSAIAYSHGQFLASAQAYPGVRLENLSNGSVRMLEDFDYYGTNCVAFSSDSQLLASGSDDQAVSLWQVTTGAQFLSLNGPSGFVKGVALSSNGQMILASGQDYGANRGTILFWRVSDGALLRTYIGQTSTAVLSVQYSPDNCLFAYARADGAVGLARNPFSSCAPTPSPTPTPTATPGQIPRPNSAVPSSRTRATPTPAP